MPKYLSGRSKLTAQTELKTDRYRYLSIENAEPNLGDPLVGPSSIIAKPVPPGQQYIMVSVEGSTSGERYWIPNQGGIIPGSISVFDDGTLVGTLSSITQLNFVGAAVSASVSIASSNLATIRVFSPGNNQEIIFNTANEFSTSTKLKFDPSIGLLSAGDRIIVGAGGSVITTTGIGSVGIGTTDPTQELHLQGDLRLTGTIYDSLNQPGQTGDLIIKTANNGITWVRPNSIISGAGGTIGQIQFHNAAGFVGGANNFYYDFNNNRVGLGSTQPTVVLDVLGTSIFKGGTTIDNLNVLGVTTTSTLAVSGTSTTRNLLVTGIATIAIVNIDDGEIDVIRIGTQNLNATGISTFTSVDINGGEIDVTRIQTQNFRATGISTIGFVTGTSAFFTGIVTASRFSGELNTSNLYVTGVSTFLQKVNINSDLGVTGLTTTQNLQVYQSTTLNRLNATGISTFTSIDINGGEIDVTRIGTQNLNVTGVGTFSSQANINNLNVTGVGTFDNIKLDTNTVSTNVGNLILDSSAGTTQINDAVYVTDTTQSTSKDGGSIVTEGGVGIEKDLYVGGQVNLATAGGITTTGGDLYVKGDLYISDDIFYDELFARNGYFTGIVSTRDLNVTGVATIATLGVTGLTTTRNLIVSGISTFNGLLDANAGATIDNIQIGISGDNEIDTFIGNLTIDSAGGTTIVDDNLTVTGNTILGDAIGDTISINGSINTNVIPTGTRDLGSSLNKWNNVYANTFNGIFIGNADSATQVSAGTTTGTSSYFLTFVDSNNAPRSNEFLYTDSGIFYNPSTDLLTTTNLTVSGTSTFNGNTTLGDAITDTVTFNARINSSVLPSTNSSSSVDVNGKDLGGTSNYWRNVYANTFSGIFIGNADSATKLATPRNFSITGDVDAPAVSFDGTANVNLVTTLDNTGVVAATYGSSTTVPVFVVDAKGRITSVTNTGIAFTTSTSAQSDAIKTVASVATTLYPTFVDSNNSPAAYESLYTDGDISYNATTNLLTVSNLTVSGNTTIGNESTDTVTFNARVNSSVLPSTNSSSSVDVNGKDLGGTSNYWRNVYANTFSGIFIGNADTATKLATARNIAITGDLSWNVNFDGSANVTSIGTLATTGVVAATYGSSTTVPVFAVDAKGRITSVTNTGINFSTATVAQSDAVRTISNETNIPFYLTFVDSNNLTAAYESLYTDSGISYNPSTDLLTTTNLTVNGTSTFNGNSILGDATTDTVFFNARVNSSVLPSTNSSSGVDVNGKDLGGTSNYWRKVYAREFSGQFIGNADTATKLATPRNFSITGDVDAPAVSFDGTGNVNLVTTLDSTGVVAATYGSSTTVPVFAVDAKGRITSVTNTGINFSTATVAQSDAVKTVASVATTLYPTFVDSNNSPAAYESLYTDAEISYNASTNLLTVSNLTVSGNTILGDDVLDRVTFNARVNSSVLPSTNSSSGLDVNGKDLGGTSNYWRNVYANNFVGAFVGNADTATKLATPRNFSITGDVDAPAVSFDGTGNVNLVTTLDNTGVVAATYGSSTTVPVFAVDAKGRITSVTNTGINFSTATVAQSDAVKTVSNETNVSFYPTFVDTNNATAAYESLYTDAEISYNPSTNLFTVGNITVSGTSTFNGNTTLGNESTDTVTFNARINSNVLPSTDSSSGVDINGKDLGGTSNYWRKVYAREFSGQFIGNADTATKLATPRNIAITGDLSWNVNFDGSANVTSTGTLANTGVVANTYGSSTTVPVFAVDAKGRITSVTNTGINFSTATVAQSDTVKTITSSATTLYPTFVDSNNNPAAYEALYTDGEISYNASTNLLTVSNIKPSGIQDTSGGTGTNNYVLTANGTGGWTWKVAATSGGAAAIGGITIQEEGSIVGNQLGITTVNFIGGSVTATSPITGTANITVSSEFPSGTRLAFHQASAPTGWTRITDDSANNRMLRVVSSGGGGTGGTNSPILMNVVPAHTHNYTTNGSNSSLNHSHSGSTDAQGTHFHSLYVNTANGGNTESLFITDAGVTGEQAGGRAYTNTNAVGAQLVGNAGNHAHNIGTNAVDLNHSHSGSTDNGSSQTNWTPRYADMILCSKD